MTDATTSKARSPVLGCWRRLLGMICGQRGVRDDLSRINKILFPLTVVAVGAAIRVGWSTNAVGPVLLWVFSSLAAGGTTGFLFGIPKSGSGARVEASVSTSTGEAASTTTDVAQVSSERTGVQGARPNTNLEEVSDWLTKIIVGLTLVNLKDIKEEVQRISLNAAEAIQPHPTNADVSAATALVVGFALIGFLAVYLYMRLFVQGAIVRSDDELHRYKSAVARAEQIGEREVLPSSDAAVVPSAASLSAAQDVADAAPPNRPELVLQPLRKLASQYEELRHREDYSRERTLQMREIVRRMQPHAIAAAPFIGELIRSPSTGDHLAAAVILQMRYMPEHMDWLARRLVEERTFIGYQAASALLMRARVAGTPECKAIQAAVASAKAERTRLNLVEVSLDKLIDKILEAH
jgi:hypothetical protein